ncbi:hypothetical protein C5C12_13490, partial [Pseudoclavibacter sp. RFBJ5]
MAEGRRTEGRRLLQPRLGTRQLRPLRSSLLNDLPRLTLPLLRQRLPQRLIRKPPLQRRTSTARPSAAADPEAADPTPAPA